MHILFACILVCGYFFILVLVCYLDVLDELLCVCVHWRLVIDDVLHSIGPAAHFTLQLTVKPV